MWLLWCGAEDFSADLFSLYAMAAACFGGLPARISVAIFSPRAFLLADLIRGIVDPL
jgi:hypothetical protein